MKLLAKKELIHHQKYVEKLINNRVFELSILFLIILNVTCFILESEKSLHESCKHIFYLVEVVSIGIFTIEYFLRLSINFNFKEITKPLMLLDLAVLLSFYCSFMVDLRFLRVLRVIRVFLLFKINKFHKALKTFASIINNKKEELILVGFFFVISLILTSSTMYLIEGPIQESFSSVPKSLWWSVITFTSVGYGDTYPITPAGKVIASIVAVLGIALYGIITSIFSAGFIEEHEKQKQFNK